MNLVWSVVIVHFVLFAVAVILTARSSQSGLQRMWQYRFALFAPIIGPLFVLGAQIAIRVKNRPTPPPHDFKDNHHMH